MSTKLAEFNINPNEPIVGRYRLDEVIGEGAAGIVIRVYDLAQNNKIVALKLLKPNLFFDAVTMARFENEFKIAQAVKHPNIIEAHNFGITQNKVAYIAMDYFEGEAVSQLIKRKALDSEETKHQQGSTQAKDFLEDNQGSLQGEAQTTKPLHKTLTLDFATMVDILTKVSEALSVIHKAGFIHRDVKPGNVLINANGEVKLTDFGFARALSHVTNLTRTVELIGTSNYLAPEIITGADIDQRCDIYSFGIMAFEMATGSCPFTGETWVTLANKHVEEPLPEFEGPARSYPSWFYRFVKKCTEKDRANRYQSFDEIVAELIRHSKTVSLWGRVCAKLGI